MCRLAAFGNCESISPTRFCLFIACQVLPLFGVTSVGLELVMPAPPPPSRKVRTGCAEVFGALYMIWKCMLRMIMISLTRARSTHEVYALLGSSLPAQCTTCWHGARVCCASGRASLPIHCQPSTATLWRYQCGFGTRHACSSSSLNAFCFVHEAPAWSATLLPVRSAWRLRGQVAGRPPQRRSPR